MHPDTREKLEALLRMLCEKGEKETFRRIRQMLRTDSGKTQEVRL